MKKNIIIGLLHLSLSACGQSLTNEKNLFHHSKPENTQLEKSKVYNKIDTLLSLNGKNVFAISDTTKSDSVRWFSPQLIRLSNPKVIKIFQNYLPLLCESRPMVLF